VDSIVRKPYKHELDWAKGSVEGKKSRSDYLSCLFPSWWDWDLNSRLEPHLQSYFALVILEMGF
jgi:hypothetical protein